MLKKILPIFFIFCLVFSLTVPCFAVAPTGYYNFVSALPSTFSYSAGYVQVSVTSNYFEDISIKYNTVSAVQWQNGISIPFYRLYANHSYFFYLESDENWVINFPQSTFSGSINISSSHFVVRTCTSANNNYFLLYPSTNPSVGSVHSIHNFYIIDVTDLELPNSEVYPYLSQFMDFSGSYVSSSQIFYNTGLLAIPHFYSDLFHSWDFFVDHGFGSWSFVTVAIAAIIAVLVFVFLVVFMIKRFTGGKT